MDGTELAARYALAPNSLSYCGKQSFAAAFSRYLGEKSEKNLLALQEELGKFTAHHGYLRLIAEANGMGPFDFEVAEAFWIGNRLLYNVDREKLAALISKEFSRPGLLAKGRARRLARDLPDGFLPHHSFHVLYLHTISGAIEPSVKNADLCRISWGKVIGTDGTNLLAKTQQLLKLNGKLSLVGKNRKWKASCSGIWLVEGARRGDLVSSHWGFAAMRITPAQFSRLEKFTLHNLKIADRG